MSKNGALKLEYNEEAPESSSLEVSLLEKISQQLDGVKELKGLDERLQVLWKLDKLDRLSYLAELQRLDKLGELDNLKKLDHLAQLDNLKYLPALRDLSKLNDLGKLDKLNHLIRLKSLNKLEELQALDSLRDLDKLDKLKDLDKLSLLHKLDNLKKIEKLDALNKLDDLRLLLQDHSDDFQKLENLKYIEKLDGLKKLQALESLDNLKALDSLSDLEKLKDLKELSKLEKLNRLNELGNLDRLEALSGLERLNKLDELRHLEKLEQMQDLSKLDYLKDTKVQRALLGLDKLSLFEENSKKFFFKLISSIFVDLFKVVAIASLMFFVFTKNISRQTFDRLIPHLGFGEADRVNLALSILSKDLSSGDFDLHYKNLESRVRREVSSIFDTKVPKNLEHYRLLENLTSYNYRHEAYDLNAYAKVELNAWATKTHAKYTDSYTYDVERMTGKPEMEKDLSHYMKGSIFMKQQKYLEAFIEMDQIKRKEAFVALGSGLTNAFYMAFRTKNIDLKLYLEKE
jgi:hypothetical protein